MAMRLPLYRLQTIDRDKRGLISFDVSNGEVVYFQLGPTVLLNVSEGVAKPNWKRHLMEFTVNENLHITRRGFPVYPFVQWLIDELTKESKVKK